VVGKTLDSSNLKGFLHGLGDESNRQSFCLKHRLLNDKSRWLSVATRLTSWLAILFNGGVMTTTLVMIMVTASIFPLIALWVANHYLGSETPEEDPKDHH